MSFVTWKLGKIKSRIKNYCKLYTKSSFERYIWKTKGNTTTLQSGFFMIIGGLICGALLYGCSSSLIISYVLSVFTLLLIVAQMVAFGDDR